MERESCPHVPCVTSGGRARSARLSCGWRGGGARCGGHGPRARSRCARGPRPPRRLDPPRAHHRTARGWPRGTTPVCRSRRRACGRRARPCARRTPIVARMFVHTARLGGQLRHSGIGHQRSAQVRRRPEELRAAGGRLGGGQAGDEEADALAVPPLEQRRERGFVDSVGVHQQDGPAVDPAAEPPEGAARAQEDGSTDSSTLPSRCAAIASAMWWVLTATADGAGQANGGQTLQRQVDQRRPPNRAQCLRPLERQRGQPGAAARGQHHACQTLPHGDRTADSSTLRSPRRCKSRSGCCTSTRSGRC